MKPASNLAANVPESTTVHILFQDYFLGDHHLIVYINTKPEWSTKQIRAEIDRKTQKYIEKTQTDLTKIRYLTEEEFQAEKLNEYKMFRVVYQNGTRKNVSIMAPSAKDAEKTFRQRFPGINLYRIFTSFDFQKLAEDGSWKKLILSEN